MSEEEMELEEARLLSAEIGLNVPDQEVVAPEPERTLATVEMEIRVIQHNTAQAMLSGAIEMGRRLEEAKAMLPHGEWGLWLRKMDFSQSTANNLMRIFREYGADQQSMFGGVAKSQAFGNLTYTKALKLLELPSSEERERFLAKHDVETMSTRELAEAIKAREEAEEAVAAAQDEIRKIKQKADLFQEQLADQEQVYQAKLTSAGVEADQARAAAQAAEEEHTRLVQELEELRNRPTEADTEAVEAARQAALDEMTEKVDKAKEAKKKAEEKRKEAEASLAAAQKELAELKAKEPEARELTQEEKDALIAAAVEQARAGDAERLHSLEKKLAQADPDVAEFKVLFSSWQEDYRKLMGALGRITDPEKAAKLRRAVQGAVEQMAG